MNQSNGQSQEIQKLLEMLQKGINEAPVRAALMRSEQVVPKGENFSSTINRLRLKLVFGDAKEKEATFIVKRVLENNGGNESVKQKMMKVFQLEVKVYAVVLKGMENLMAEFHDNRAPLWCHYLGGCSTYIVLEDLAESGFLTLSRIEKMNTNDACQALEALGRFHAMSKVLIQRGIIKMGHFPHNSLTDTDFGKKIYAGPLALLSQVIAESWGREWTNVSKRLLNEVALVGDKMCDLADSYDSRFVVLNHGDFWNCNILRKSTGASNRRQEFRFVDFQLPMLNSFIWDVMIFLGSCVESSTRMGDTEALLAAYQKSLETNLNIFGWRGYIPTMKDVEQEAARTSYASFVFNTCYFPVLTAPEIKPMKLNKLLDSPPEEVFDKRAFSNNNITSGLKFEVAQYFKNGVF